MKIVKFKEQNKVYAESQDEYQNMPAHMTPNGIVTSCWKMGFKERVKVLFTGIVWVRLWTMNGSPQPQMAQVEKPDDL